MTLFAKVHVSFEFLGSQILNLITLEKEGVSTVCSFLLVANAITDRALMHLKFSLQTNMNCQVLAKPISGDLSHCSSVSFNFQYFNS